MSKQSQLQPLREKITALSGREKWMLLVTGFIIVVGVLDFFVIQPMRDKRAAYDHQINTMQIQQQDFTQQLNEITVQIANDPAMVTSREIEGLDKAIQKSEERLLKFTSTLVSPQEMTSMLRDIFRHQKNLELIELTNLAVSPLLTEEQQQETSPDIGLYRHPVRLIFEGNYTDTLNYLKALESMPNRFYWNRFDYQVLEYPKARVSLNIYTLSTQKWWLGDVES